MRWLLAAAVVLILAGLAGSAAAQRGGDPSAQELWQQYPMEPAPPRPPPAPAPDDQPAPSARPKEEPAAKTPIRHFISLMQENHSFDNYFGTYPGADGIPKGACMPVDPTAGGKPCIEPFRIGHGALEDINQSARVFRAQHRRGRMDGFVSAIARERGGVQPLVMGHYDDRDIPFYWNVADDFVLFDRFFTASRGGSAANHAYWVSGRPGTDAPTIFDRLERAGVSWKFYVQDYDPHDPKRFPRTVPIDDLYEDLRRGTLPAVSYVVPARRSSEHPPEPVTAGETLVRSLVSTLMRSRYWHSSAFMWTYDDWGGWYDHVRPPRVDRDGYGFRVPALLVSAYAKQGHIEHATMDSTSMLKFVEENWDLEPLARRDRRATSIARAFDFSRGPREAVFLSRDRRATPLAEPKRVAVYAAYSVAVGLALAVIALAIALDRRTPAVAAMAALLLVAWPASPARAAPTRQEVRLETVPPIAGVEIVQGGRSYRTDRRGRVTMLVAGRFATPRVEPKELRPGVTARLSRFYGTRSRSLRAGLSIYYEVRPSFIDERGAPVAADRVRRFVFKSSIGVRTAGSGGEPVELQGSRASLVGRRGALRSRPISYSVDSVDVDGSNVVHRGRVRFFPSQRQVVPIKLLFYDVAIAARDALFGVSRGSSIHVRYPDGRVERRPLDDGGRVRLAALARGDYRIRVDAAGLGTSRVIVLSRDQQIELAVLSYLDLAVLGAVLALVATVLLLVRRPALRARLGWFLARPFATGLLALVLAGSLTAAPAAGAAQDRQPVGIWAYYYIWFNVSSWDRAKIDYPALGRYSSDEPSIMRQHIRLAKKAGIDRFIVGWKSTPTLDTRLRDLIRVAEQERFRLALIYQALDFERRPLPIERVTFDLGRFRRHFAASPVFGGFGRPVVIWSGTWEFSRPDLESVAAEHRDGLRLLATERNPDGYLARGAPFEGNAYYWSSVNPDTYPRYLPKLRTMGRMVHEQDGLWIAPAAPGFDARALGHRTVVRRDGGRTLRRQLNTAQRSEPDAIGLISWNEFSENTHVEPSRKYGTRALEVIADAEGTDFEVKADLDSSAAVPREGGQSFRGLAATLGVVVVGLGALVVLSRRRRSPSLSGG